MKIQDWGGGMATHEVDAINKIKQAFKEPDCEASKN